MNNEKQQSYEALQRKIKKLNEAQESGKNKYNLIAQTEYDKVGRIYATEGDSYYRETSPSGGHFKSNELYKSLKLSQKTDEENKEIADSEQKILDLYRIAVQIEEFSRLFNQL
ncbi:hypothetical protein AYI70_g11518 [Smittium culicis]|uniref:Uncharacterized protein n=1 Tax=Smittium culicis TaxID=133412 RepID=A0A1R1X1M5_9FUNG|nr:hypothetical protein AYI70_g11518 [Smittium culicis]